MASGHDSAEYVLIDRTNVDETKRRQPGKTKDVLSVKRDITGRKSRRPLFIQQDRGLKFKNTVRIHAGIIRVI